MPTKTLKQLRSFMGALNQLQRSMSTRIFTSTQFQFAHRKKRVKNLFLWGRRAKSSFCVHPRSHSQHLKSLPL